MGLLSHDVLGGARRQRRHLRLPTAQLVRRVHQANRRVGAEHGVVALLSVDELQLVEFHVLCCLLDSSLLLQNLLLQVVDELEVLGPRRPLVIQLRNLNEALIQLLVLLVHQQRSILELALQLCDFLSLLLNELLHGLAQVVLELDLLLFKLGLDFASACVVLLDALLHFSIRVGNLLPHRVYLAVLSTHSAFKTVDFGLELFDFSFERVNFGLHSRLLAYVLLIFAIMLLLQLLHSRSMCLINLHNLSLVLVAHSLDHGLMILLQRLDSVFVLLIHLLKSVALLIH